MKLNGMFDIQLVKYIYMHSKLEFSISAN